MSQQPIAILCALEDEIARILEIIKDPITEVVGRRTFIRGTINGKEVVAAYSSWGKVAVAVTALTLIRHFKVSKIVMIGVAGALQSQVKVGDIIISKNLFQHDFDPRPSEKRFVLPILNVATLPADEELIKAAKNTIERVLPNLKPFKDQINCYEGDIATGDRIVTTREARQEIHNLLPSTYCVDMESAALAQVCLEEHIPFVVIRGISDDLFSLKFEFQYIRDHWQDNAKIIIEKLIPNI